MLKRDYLNDKYVREFSLWLSERLDTADLAHSWLNRWSGGKWSCGSIYNAFQKYAWPFNVSINSQSLNGTSFRENHHALVQIQDGLRDAVEAENDELTLDWCLAVMRWGGVVAGNGEWLRKNMNGLASLLKHNVELLSGWDADDEKLSCIERFNSGMTKVYSLLLDDFIIYDTRVAAALGWFIVEYCKMSGLKQVPEVLRFAWGPAKEGTKVKHPKLRNPGIGDYKFPIIVSGPKHAAANLKASWLLWDVLQKNPDSAFNHEKDSLRALEAAMFMIGYDLGNAYPETVQNIPKPTILNEDETRWDGLHYNFETRGKNCVKFKFAIVDGALYIHNNKGRQEIFPVEQLHSIVVDLYSQFQTDWFPLANNVAELGKGTEKKGLGTTILNLQPGNITHAQASSYLGRVFEEIGLVEWNGKRIGISWRLMGEPLTLEDFQDYISQLDS